MDLIKKHTLTNEQINEMEDNIDKMSLNKYIIYTNKQLKTISDLRKIAKSLDIIKKLEGVLDEDDYCYIYDWWLQYNL
jgi:hypothetical protein